MATEATTQNLSSQTDATSSSSTMEPELGFMNDEDEQDQAEAAGAGSIDDVTPEKSKTSDTKTGASGGTAGDDEADKKDSAFECNICLDVASDAVISMCGHLFCWPCLHQWLETRPHNQICPVCKAGISRDKVVPLYGRGSADAKDPRDKPIPPRPRGQRSEPESSSSGQAGFWGMGNGAGGFQMSFGIGAFPFGFFATNLNFGDGALGGGQAPVGSPQYEEEQFLHKVFLWIAFAFIFWLLIA